MATIQNDICAIQARSRDMLGQNYARNHAAMHWTRWRNELCDAGMTWESATEWLIDNTEVERAWVDAMEARYAAGREKQIERLRKLAEEGA